MRPTLRLLAATALSAAMLAATAAPAAAAPERADICVVVSLPKVGTVIVVCIPFAES